MANGRNLTVYLTSDVSKFRNGLKQAESRMDTFRKRVGTAAAGAAAALGAAAVAFGVEGVKAAADDEKATKRLAKTMENLGKAQDVDKAEDFIEALMKQTGIADDELRPAFEKLVQATGDTDGALRLLKTALDTSVGAGKPLETITAGIAKGMNGQVGALERLVPGLDDAAIKADPLNEILKQLNKRFGGQAAAQAETYGGKMAAVGTAFGEVQEAFGKGLLGNLDGANDSMGGMDDTLYSLAPEAEKLGAALGIIATNGANAVTALGPLADILVKINENMPGLLTSNIFDIGNNLYGRIGVVAAQATGNEAAYVEAARRVTIGPEVPVAGPYPGSGWPSYRPMRIAQRYADAKGRADGRAAQKDSRTRQAP